jgi:Transcriptional regulatory protein, C terminal
MTRSRRNGEEALPEQQRSSPAVGQAPARFALRLFGGVELCDSVVSGARNRRLVALLAARRNEWVSKWDIINALWDGDPPNSAESTLSAMLSRLRGAREPSTSLALPNANSGNYTLTAIRKDAISTSLSFVPRNSWPIRSPTMSQHTRHSNCGVAFRLVSSRANTLY